MKHTPQTHNEEIANTVTHALGIVLAIIGIPALFFALNKGASATTVWAIGMFGLGVFMVYVSSTIYHAVKHDEKKRILRIWDHISIYFLIGGSYTAIVQKYTDSHTATWFLTIMWGIIALGCVMKLFFTGKYELLSVLLYIGLGWMAVILIKPLNATMPLPIFSWVLAGGIAYTSGIFFFINKRVPYNHAIWHLFVLAGTVAHYVAIYKSIGIPVAV